MTFWEWVKERHAIWERRQAGLHKPWTEDRILQTFRFCNVFRELDTVTIWIKENIRGPFAKHEHLWFMLAIARTINLPSTLQELIETPGAWPIRGELFSPEHMTFVLDERKLRGEQIYTGAYMIRAESNRRQHWFYWTKQKYISEIVLGRLWEDRENFAARLAAAVTLEKAWRLLKNEARYTGWGPFMSYEWVTDLRHTRYLNQAPDIMTWANAGPGALRGLQRLRHPEGRLEGKPLNQGEALTWMRQLLEEAPLNLPPTFPALEMRDIEHSLCEYDKWCRVFHFEGKPRARYDGAGR